MSMKDLLTEHEHNNIETRRAIAIALDAGWSYARIAKELRVSPATISRVKRMVDERQK